MGFGESFANTYSVLSSVKDRRAQMAQAAEERKFQRGMQALGMVQEISTRQAKYGADMLTIGDQVNAGLPALTKAQNDYQVASDRLAALSTLGASQEFLKRQEAVVASAKANVEGLGAHLSFLANSQRFMVTQTNQLDQQRASLLPLLSASGIQMPQQGAGGEGAAPSADGKAGESLGGLPQMSRQPTRPGEERFNQPAMVAADGTLMSGDIDAAAAEPVSGEDEPTSGGGEQAGPPMSPLMDGVYHFTSLGFNNTITDGRTITITTDSTEDARRASDSADLLKDDPVFAGRIRIIDREAEGEKNFSIADKVMKNYASAQGRAARYKAAMNPTATQAMILDMATAASQAGDEEQSSQLTMMAGSDVENRKAIFKPYADLADEEVSDLKQDIAAARAGRHAYVQSRGIGGVSELVPPPLTGRAAPAAAEARPGMTPEEFKAWYASQNGLDAKSMTIAQKQAANAAYQEYKKK